MDYVFLAIAVACVSLQLIFTKLFQKKVGDSALCSVVFNTVTALFSALLYLCLSGFRVLFSAYSLVMASLLAVIFSANALLAIQICRLGNVSVYTLFLMLGGMTLPFIYGAACLGERVSAFRYAALVLLAAALVLQCLSGGRRGEKTPKVFYLFCALIFLSNGMASVVSKMHQDPAWLVSMGLAVSPVETNSFLVLTYAFMLLVNAAVLGAFLLRRKARQKTERKVEEERYPLKDTPQRKLTFKDIMKAVAIILVGAVFSSVGYLMQLLGARNLDASLLYPIVTGGTIVLSTLLGLFVFRERPNKFGIIGVALAFCATVLFAF